MSSKMSSSSSVRLVVRVINLLWPHHLLQQLLLLLLFLLPLALQVRVATTTAVSSSSKGDQKEQQSYLNNNDVVAHLTAAAANVTNSDEEVLLDEMSNVQEMSAYLSRIGLLESDKLRTAFSELVNSSNNNNNNASQVIINKKRIGYSQKVKSNTALQQYIEANSLKIIKEVTAREPHLNINILTNSTTIFVVKSINQYYYWKYVQNVSTVLIFALIVVGNISILHRLKSCRRRRSNVNYFIVQLAIADLFVGVFSVTLDSIFRLTMTFPFGLLTCRIYKYMSSSFTYSATYLLVALSFDRWEAVVKPLAFTQNHRRGQHLVMGAWLLSFICASPVFIDLRIKEVQGHPQCYIDHSPAAWRYYVVYLSVSLFVLPALLIAICYVHIVYTIWGKGQLVKKQRRALRRQLSAQQQQQQVKVKTGTQVSSGDVMAVTVFESNGEKLAKLEDEFSEPTDVESSSSLDEDDDDEDDEEEEEDDESEEENEQRKCSTLLTSLPPTTALPSTECKVNGANAQSTPADRSFKAVNKKSNNKSLFSSSSSSNNNRRRSNCKPSTTVNERRSRKRAMRSSQMSNSRCATPGKLAQSNDQKHYYIAQQQQHGSGVIPRARIKTIKMTLVIVAAFVLCWLPFCVINLCSAYGILDRSSVPKTALLTLSQSLAHLNSAANPIIFWLFSSKRATNRPISSGATPALGTGNEQQQQQQRRSFISTDSRMFENTGTSANNQLQLNLSGAGSNKVNAINTSTATPQMTVDNSC